MIAIPSSELQNYPEVPRNLQAVRSLAYQGDLLRTPSFTKKTVKNLGDESFAVIFYD